MDFLQILNFIYISAFAIYFVNIISISNISNKINKSLYSSYIITSISFLLYSGLIIYSLLQGRNVRYDHFLIPFLPILASLGFQSYLKLIGEFLTIQSRFLNFTRGILWLSIFIFSANWFVSLFTHPILYNQVDPDKSISKFIQLAQPHYLYNNYGKLIIGIILFSCLCSLLLTLKHLKVDGIKREKFIAAGLLFSVISIINDALLGREFFIYIIPLLPISFIFESLRLKTYFLTNLTTQIGQLENKANSQSNLIEYAHVAGNIAHDLRNPMSVLSGQLDLLNKSLSKIDSSQTKNINLTNVKKMKDYLLKMNGIITTHLSFVRRNEKVQKENVLPQLIIDNSLSICESKIYESNLKNSISIENDLSPEKKIYIRAPDIEVMLMNIISNACDQHKKSENCWLNIRVFENPKSNVVIQIIDSGPGFSLNDENRIFQRGESSKGGENNSAGLGLSIVTKLAERNSATVRLMIGHENAGFEIEFINENINFEEAI